MDFSVDVAGACWTPQGVGVDDSAFRVIGGPSRSLSLALAAAGETYWGHDDLLSPRVSRFVLDALEIEARRVGLPPKGRCARVFAAAAKALNRLPPPGPELMDPCEPDCRVVYAYVEQGAVWVAWVGGGAALLVRSGRILYMTKPHIRWRELVKPGGAPPGRPRDTGTTRRLKPGSAPPVETLTAPWAWMPGDRLVLVSGTVLHVIDDQEVARLASEGSNEHAARALVGVTILGRYDSEHIPVDACAVIASLSPTQHYFW